jgi:hypothetical protein
MTKPSKPETEQPSNEIREEELEAVDTATLDNVTGGFGFGGNPMMMMMLFQSLFKK